MSDRMGPFDPDNADDEVARRLRELLSSQGQAITPSADALTTIRQKIRAQDRGNRRYAWRRVLQVGAAGLGTVAVAAIAVIVGVAVRHHAPAADHHAVAVASPTVTSTPTATPTPAPMVEPVAPVSSAPSTYAVSVYYVDKRKDPEQLLFREQTVAPTSPQHTFVKDAVTAMLSTPAHDPDYTSYWPAGTTVNAVNITGETTAVVDLSAQAANGPAGKGAISAEQLLYTIIASAPKIDGLQLRINGTPVTSLWGSPLAATVAPQPPWQVLGHVWITSPQQDETVASSVTISGEASVFEATVSYQILRNGGVLKHGSTNATIGAPDRGTWSVTVSGLAPGPYTVRAYEVSAKDGSITHVDDKAFTVN